MLGWLYRAIERWARATPARLNRVLDHVPLWYVRRLAEAKLVRTLRYVWRNAPVQRERWRDAGVTLRDLRSPDVLRHLPFTTGRQLAESPEAFFCVPRSELIHVMGSSGTKGFVKKTYLTHDDLERHLRLAGTHLRRFPGGTRAMAMFPLAYPTWCAGPLVREAITHAGMLGLLSDTQRSIDDQMATIRDYQINVLMSNASYMHRLTLEAGEDLKALGVRYIHLGAQAWSETLREEIETAWGAKAIDCYGSAEFAYAVASECRLQKGLHLSEVDLWPEVVSPATGEVLPDGEEGELVLTTLSRRGMPLVRYRTSDLARLIPRGERCACGLPLRKMSRVRGRIDDMIISGGANIYPHELDHALLSVAGVSDYQLSITQDHYTDVFHLTVEADTQDDGVEERVLRALRDISEIHILLERQGTITFDKVRVVPRGALSAGRPKTVRIIDNRP